MKHLTEDQIIAILDGTLTEGEKAAVIEHVRTCEKCRKEIKEILDGEDALDRFLGFNKGIFCPSPDELADYVEKKASEEVVKHVASCKYCQDIVELLKSDIEDKEGAKIPEGTEDRMLSLLQQIRSSRHPQPREDEPSPVIEIPESLFETLDAVHQDKAFLESLAEILNAVSMSAFPADFEAAFEKHRTRFAEPLRLMVLTPRSVRRLAADEGLGFEQEIKVEPGASFKAVIEQFGSKIRLKFVALDEKYRWSLVRFRLTEGSVAKVKGVASITDGEGIHVLDTREGAVEPPEHEHYLLQIDVISSEQTLKELEKEAAVEALCSLLRHSDPVVRRSSAILLGFVGGDRTLRALEDAREDPDEHVRNSVEQAIDRISP